MRNIFLKGIPKGFCEEDIGRLALCLGATVTSSMVWKDKRGKSRGVALVEVETEEQADILTQGLQQRAIRRAQAGQEDQHTVGEHTVIGEGEGAWVLYEVEEGDKTALIVEKAFREANHVRGPEDAPPRKPKVKEDPIEKQKRCEILRRERLLARRAELETGVQREERDCLLTLDKVRRMRAKFGTLIGQRCTVCWLLHPQCICTPATPPSILANFRHRTIVWLHCKEFGRLSNTGGLITVAFPPPQSRVLVAGLEEDEEKFMAELERDPEATFVLFPTDDALTAEEFMKLAGDERATQSTGEETERSTDQARRASHAPPDSSRGHPEYVDGKRVYTIILVDGTWQQARRLALKIPEHIKRVKLMPREAIDPVYKSPMRSQATPDRVCSLSAYVLLLKELNTPPQVCEYLFHLLHQKSEIVMGNSGKEWKQTDGLHSTPKLKPPRIRRKKAVDCTLAEAHAAVVQ